MKKVLLSMLAIVVSMTITAGNVTPDEALQKATFFVQNRMAKGDGPRLAPGMAPRLTMAGKVCGLFVFNVQDEGGYVIVSPDDRTEAILGFSDSGHLDLNNIPDNMREWLQGYANEIASLTVEGGLQTTDNGLLTEEGGLQTTDNVMAATRINVPPIVTAHWDQFDPYNRSTPTIGSDHTLTGCVAVAMSQSMHVFQHPSAVAKDIPGYTTYTEGLWVDRIPAGTTIDWGNMLTTYGWYNYDDSGWQQTTFSDTQAAAVSDLMLYCGASVEMDYGLSFSGSGTFEAAQGLTKYLDYEKNTTMHLSRSSYNDNQWKEILYHEVSNGRPVIYSGSGNGGHAFVCDGYKTGDYFHFNWGFSTAGADGYYLIGSLNPENTSYDFNNYNQCVIGIQPTGNGGSVSSSVFSATEETVRLVDVEAAPDPVYPGSELTITATVQNLTNTTVNTQVIFVEVPRSSFNWNDVVESTMTSGEIKQVSKTVTAPSSEGELVYQIIGVSGGYYMLFGYTDPITVSYSATGITSPTPDKSSKGEGSCYSLDGRKLEGQPTQPGIYVINGKKVVIK